MKACILLIEDFSSVRQTIVSILLDDGYEVRTAATFEDAKNLIRNQKYDAYLLDIQLPDGNGLNLIPFIRQHNDAPVLIISGRTDTIDMVVGLEMGADDYIKKPIQLKEMSARIRAQIRRYKSLTDLNNIESVMKRSNVARMRFGNFTMDRMQMQVFDENGCNMGLTVREFRLLEALVLAPRQVHTREQLLNKVRSDNLDITDRAVDVQLLRIRRKLGDNIGSTQLIRAVRGMGYMLDAIAEAAD